MHGGLHDFAYICAPTIPASALSQIASWEGVGGVGGGVRDLTQHIIAPLPPTNDYPHTGYAAEGPPPLSSTLTHLRPKARGDHRTQSRNARTGSQTRALSHRNHRPCRRHPAPRGNVQGLVDHEAKVRAALIGSEDWKTPRPRTRRSAPLTSMASMSTLKTSSFDTKFGSSDHLHDGLRRKRRGAGRHLHSKQGIALRSLAQANTRARSGVRGMAHARRCGA